MPLPERAVTNHAQYDRSAGRGGEERTFTISELADTFQVTPRTIRFYEDQGLLSPRRDGLNRVYSHRDRARLTLICRGKRLGFSLAEIKDFLDLYDVDDRQIEQMRFALAHGRERIASLEVQLVDVQQTLSELRALENQIVEHLKAAGAAPDKLFQEINPTNQIKSVRSIQRHEERGDRRLCPVPLPLRRQGRADQVRPDDLTAQRGQGPAGEDRRRSRRISRT